MLFSYINKACDQGDVKASLSKDESIHLGSTNLLVNLALKCLSVDDRKRIYNRANAGMISSKINKTHLEQL